MSCKDMCREISHLHITMLHAESVYALWRRGKRRTSTDSPPSRHVDYAIPSKMQGKAHVFVKTFKSSSPIEANSTPEQPLALKALKKAPVCTSEISSLSHLCINILEVESSRFFLSSKILSISGFDILEDIIY